MKKKTPAPTTEAAPAGDGHLALYLLLEDGTPAKRLRPLTIGERTYYNLPVGPEGKPRRIPAEKLRDFIAK